MGSLRLVKWNVNASIFSLCRASCVTQEAAINEIFCESTYWFTEPDEDDSDIRVIWCNTGLSLPQSSNPRPSQPHTPAKNTIGVMTRARPLIPFPHTSQRAKQTGYIMKGGISEMDKSSMTHFLLINDCSKVGNSRKKSWKIWNDANYNNVLIFSLWRSPQIPPILRLVRPAVDS